MPMADWFTCTFKDKVKINLAYISSHLNKGLPFVITNYFNFQDRERYQKEAAEREKNEISEDEYKKFKHEKELENNQADNK